MISKTPACVTCALFETACRCRCFTGVDCNSMLSINGSVARNGACMRLVCRLVLTCIVLSGCPVQAENWILLTHSSDGQVTNHDGQLHGIPHAGKRAFFVELVLRLQRELQLNAHMQDVPLSRGWSLLQIQRHVALFNLDRTSLRESNAQWVGPIWHESDYFYEQAAHPSGVKNMAEARNLPVCVLGGSVHDQLLSQQGFTHLMRSFSYQGCWQMLMAGRVMLVASSRVDLASKLRDLKINTQDVTALPFVINHSDGYIALSRDTPLVEVNRWQLALDHLRTTGVYEQLYQQFAQ